VEGHRGAASARLKEKRTAFWAREETAHVMLDFSICKEKKKGEITRSYREKGKTTKVAAEKETGREEKECSVEEGKRESRLSPEKEGPNCLTRSGAKENTRPTNFWFSAC